DGDSIEEKFELKRAVPWAEIYKEVSGLSLSEVSASIVDEPNTSDLKYWYDHASTEKVVLAPDAFKTGWEARLRAMSGVRKSDLLRKEVGSVLAGYGWSGERPTPSKTVMTLIKETITRVEIDTRLDPSQKAAAKAFLSAHTGVVVWNSPPG